ncbi:hypothetical protein NGRA_0488 [Nosema granulosis]|uniref:Uncharacterized protein n=1 Tax=Nosema granulosis TaxID=83296 RepID=A0A9P6H0U7_9MICR|nr:hypothetical protein NGRA_0488 [Nosema granulosis]
MDLIFVIFIFRTLSSELNENQRRPPIFISYKNDYTKNGKALDEDGLNQNLISKKNRILQKNSAEVVISEKSQDGDIYEKSCKSTKNEKMKSLINMRMNVPH